MKIEFTDEITQATFHDAPIKSQYDKTKEELKKLLKEHLEISVSTWTTTDEYGHDSCSTNVEVWFDGELVSEQNN